MPAVPVRWTVTALGAANSLGMLAAGGLLVRGLARHAGAPSLAGFGRAVGSGGLGAVLGAGAAAGLAALLEVHGKVANGLLAGGLAAVAACLCAAVVLVLDRDAFDRLVPGRGGGRP